MATFFLTLLAVACLVSLVPLSVWAASGSLKQASFALRRYLLVMGCIVVPGVILALIVLIQRLF